LDVKTAVADNQPELRERHMRNMAVVLIAMTLAPFAFADDAQPTAPKAAPKSPAKSSPSGKVNGQFVDNMSFDQLQKQMLATQEARLPL